MSRATHFRNAHGRPACTSSLAFRNTWTTEDWAQVTCTRCLAKHAAAEAKRAAKAAR